MADRHAAAEHAGPVVVNIRDERERDAAARLVAEAARLRDDEDLLKHILGRRGRRITALVASVAEQADPGLKKALARVRRAVRSVSAW